jgi:septal ring factor EnvC (AmiA/AmiB activator)
MRNYRKALMPTLAAAVLFAGAGEAMARTPQRAEAIRHQIEELRRDVNRSDNRNRVSEREAAGLRRDVDQLQRLLRDYNRDGLSNWEMRNLENRIQSIRARLHNERHDRDHHRR